MCIASNYIAKLESWYKGLNDDYEKLRKLQSAVDKEIADISHEIERSRFNVVQGYKLAKRMHDTLQKRRVIKGEMAKLQSIRVPVRSRINLPQLNQRLTVATEKDAELRTILNTSVDITID